MIWSKQVTVQELNQLCRNTLCEQLGIEFTDIGNDYLIASMPVDHRTKQPAGLLHGGASVALAETLGSVASTLCVRSETESAVGVEVNANHLKAVRTGTVFGKVTPVRLGRTLHVWHIEIRTESGDLSCTGRLTTMVVGTRRTGE